MPQPTHPIFFNQIAAKFKKNQLRKKRANNYLSFTTEIQVATG